MMQFAFGVHAILLAGLSIVLSGCGSGGTTTTTTTSPVDEHVMWWTNIQPNSGRAAGLGVGADGTVFLTGDDGLSALDGFRGDLLWKLETGVIGRPTGKPVVGPRGSLYVLAEKNGTKSVVAVGSNGTPIWIQDFNKSDTWQFCPGDEGDYWVPNSVVLGSDGTVFVSKCSLNSTASLYALDADNGNIKWQSSAAGPSWKPSPVIAPDDTIFLTDVSGHVFAVRGTDGSVLWNVSLPTGAWNSGLPSLGANSTVLICTDAGLFAIDGKDGSVKWQQEDACFGTSFGSFGATAGPDGTVYVESSRPSGWATAEAKFHALHGDDGSIKWTIGLANDELECYGGACELTMAAVDAVDDAPWDSIVYVGLGTSVWALDYDGNIVWYSTNKGWLDPPDNAHHYPPVVSTKGTDSYEPKGTALFVAFSETLYAYNPEPWRQDAHVQTWV